MTNVIIYTKDYCPYCERAKALLDRKNISYHEIDVTYDEALQKEMRERSQRRTVPQIFVEEMHIGGSDELLVLDRSGELDRLFDTRAAA
jgi:GrxC family glutaredoxin